MIIEPMEQDYNLADQARQKLMSAIPEAFVDGKILWEKLRESLGDLLDDDDETVFEHYGLNWPGKRKAKKVAATPSTLTLRPLKGEGIDEDITENIFIEGDNLEVLKILYKSYKEKIKMIYIDPPYNTGNDFVYNDDFRMTEDEFMRADGSVDDQGNRLISNKKTSGRFHASWLNMMYPRLKIARELLKDDGVILISIDDNEVHNLRLLCDEIFGEINFASTFIVKSNPRGSQSNLYSASVHEYILCYVKNTEKRSSFEIPLNESMLQEYNLEDEGGKYRLLGLRLRGGAWRREERPLLYYPIFINPENGAVSLVQDALYTQKVLPIKPTTNEDGTWRWGKEKFSIDKHLLIAKQVSRGDESVWDIYQKDYLNSVDGAEKGTKPKTIWDEKESNYQNGTNEIKAIFDNKNVFDFPKPIFIIERSALMLSDKEAIVLDFFAGSGSTADAVLKLNSQDGGNRKYICVQIPEATNSKSEAYKEGYRFISQITKERIRRVSMKIKDDTPDYEGDVGLKVFKTTRSNHKKWGKYSINTPKEADGLFVTHQHSLIDNWEYDSVMTEIILTEGFSLTSKIKAFDSVATNQISHISDPDKEYVLYVCLDEQINPNTIKVLNMNDNDIFVCLGSAIDDQNLSALHDKGRIRTL